MCLFFSLLITDIIVQTQTPVKSITYMQIERFEWNKAHGINRAYVLKEMSIQQIITNGISTWGQKVQTSSYKVSLHSMVTVANNTVLRIYKLVREKKVFNYVW